MTDYPLLHFNTRAEWRRWLKSNFNKSTGIWFLFYKVHTGKKSISYNDAVEEALCYGWIDSIIKKIDDESYKQKFTPRINSKVWSPTNIRRVKKLIAEKKMTKPGLALFPDKFLKVEKPEKIKPSIEETPQTILQELKKYPKALEFFNSLAPSYKRNYIRWINSAKRDETRMKRLNEAAEMLTRKIKTFVK